MTATIITDVPIAFFVSNPNTYMRRGTIIIPPPRPVIEENMPATIPAGIRNLLDNFSEVLLIFPDLKAMSIATINRRELIIYFKMSGLILTANFGNMYPLVTLANDIMTASLRHAFLIDSCFIAELKVANEPANSEVATGTSVALIPLFWAVSMNNREGRKIMPPPTPSKPANIPPVKPVKTNKKYSVDHSPNASRFE